MIIDHCYENVIAKLTAQGRFKDVSQKLLSLKTNNERVLYITEIFEELNAFPSLLKVDKNESVSTYYRNQGNQIYMNKKIYEAWQYYNLAILHAPTQSECYYVAVSNRSAIFISLKMYVECLTDIEKVLKLECSVTENIKTKLEDRKKRCLEQMKRKTKVLNRDPPNVLELRGRKSARYLGTSTKIQVVHSEEMGRHVIATENLKVGEVLVEEDPYFTIVLKSQMLFCCNYCLARNLNLEPCKYCCFFFYCSDQCKQKAWNEYHSVECSLMATLVDMQFTRLELLALRTVIKARSEQNSWDSLFKIVEEAEAHIKTEYHGHVKINDKWVYESKYYTSIHTLLSNVDKRSISDIFQKSVTAAVFFKILSDSSNFLKGETEKETEKIRQFVAGILLHHIMTSPTNMHGISANIEGDLNNEQYVDEVSIASAPYAIHSLLNHSCAPNVVRFSVLGCGRMKLFVLRPIKKGMQIFDNYGPHHTLEDRTTRRASLKFQYNFICNCEACLNNWPTFMIMGFSRGRNSNKIPLQLLKRKDKVLNNNNFIKLHGGDYKVARKIYTQICTLCEELDGYGPCMELCDCQEALKQCLMIFQGVIPYRNNESIQWSAKPPDNLSIQ